MAGAVLVSRKRPELDSGAFWVAPTGNQTSCSSGSVVSVSGSKDGVQAAVQGLGHLEDLLGVAYAGPTRIKQSISAIKKSLSGGIF